jgi:oligopeptidase B
VTDAPIAKRVPTERTHHGDTVVDDFAWLTDKDDPATRAYLEAENAYTEATTEHLAPLRETIFGEIKQRTRETDLSVPTRKGGYWYYTRTVEGQQYGIHCRRAVAPVETEPPATGDRCRARRCCSTATSWLRGTSSSRSAPST